VRKRKSKRKKEDNMKDISQECFILSEEPRKDTHGNYRIIKIRTLGYSRKKKCNKSYI